MAYTYEERIAELDARQAELDYEAAAAHDYRLELAQEHYDSWAYEPMTGCVECGGPTESDEPGYCGDCVLDAAMRHAADAAEQARWDKARAARAYFVEEVVPF